MNTPESILKSTFGYDTFKLLQREIIANMQARRDTMVIMPTGGGKSPTYQAPALLFDGSTVVPLLIALSNLNPDQQMAVFKAFDTMGSDMLKPIYNTFNGTVNYDKLKILRMYYLYEERQK